MHGLAVRWSLKDAAPDTFERLRAYVRDESFSGFDGLEGLRFKTWRARPGEWFEGTYVFVSSAAREGFEAMFRERADLAPGSRLVGSSPILIEPFEVFAVAEGGAKFAAADDYASL